MTAFRYKPHWHFQVIAFVLSAAVFFEAKYTTTNAIDQQRVWPVAKDLPEYMQWHVDHAIQVSRRLQQPAYENICDFFESFIDNVPNGRDNCICQDHKIDCIHDEVCRGGVCTEAVEMMMSLRNNSHTEELSVTTCSLLPGFEETCLKVDIGSDRKILECTDATYGTLATEAKGCECNVCPENNGVQLDCSKHDPMAVTDGCIQVDTMNLTGAIPIFQSPFVNNVGNIQPIGTTEVTDWSPTPQSSTFAPNSCDQVRLLDELVSPDARDSCGCDEATISCHYGSVCSSKNGVCAGSVDISIDFSDGLLVTSCANYSDSFEEMCFDLIVSSDDQELSQCTGTYGGKECSCQVCEEGGRGVSIDCSEYNPLAITDGCQELTATQMFSTSDGPCGELEYVVNRMPEDTATCTCNGDSVNCEYAEVCREDDGICAAPVEMALTFEGKRSFSSCSEFTTDFERTCVEISIAGDRLLDECVSATYGGNTCFCEVCEDRTSVNIDCSIHKPLASTGGCQDVHLLDLSLLQLRPFVPEFRIDALQVMGSLGSGNDADSGAHNSFGRRLWAVGLLISFSVLFGVL